jgi:hypothetical protein
VGYDSKYDLILESIYSFSIEGASNVTRVSGKNTQQVLQSGAPASYELVCYPHE